MYRIPNTPKKSVVSQLPSTITWLMLLISPFIIIDYFVETLMSYTGVGSGRNTALDISIALWHQNRYKEVIVASSLWVLLLLSHNRPRIALSVVGLLGILFFYWYLAIMSIIPFLGVKVPL